MSSSSAGPPAPIGSSATARRPSRAFDRLRPSRRIGGVGAPFARRAPIALIAALAVIASLAICAAPALAAPPTVTTPVVSEAAYTTAHVSSEVDPQAQFAVASYVFQVSTNGTDWSDNAAGTFFQKEMLNAELTGLQDGTHYFVRLVAAAGFGGVSDPPEVISSGPDPSFTTLTAEAPTIPGPVAATQVFSTSATATATVHRPANSDDVECHFEYVTDEAFGSTGFAGATVRPCDPNPIGEGDAGTDREVTAPLGCTAPVLEDPASCLEPATAYRLRVVVKNAAGEVTKEAASAFTTEPRVAAPSVLAVDDVADPAQNTAEVSGEVQRPAGADPALDVQCRFEYVTQAEWEAESNSFPAGAPSTPCAENPITAASADGEGKQKVGAQLGGLKPGTVYHVRLAAENSGGTDTEEAADTFTTLPAELPTVSIDPVEGGTYTTAHVTGTVDIDDAGHDFVRPYFEISTDNLNWSVFEAPSGNLHAIEHDYTDLQPSTTYFFRIAGTYSAFGLPEAEANGEVAYSPVETITTGNLFPPSADNFAVTNVTATTAHLSATVDPHAPSGPLSEAGKEAFATHWEFVCAPECLNANGNPIQGVVQGEEGAQVVGGDARRLEGNSHYEVSLLIHSEGGEETLGPIPFDTELAKPTIRVAPGGSDGKGGYTLQGIVNPNGSEVGACEFKWGPNSSSYAFSAPCSPPPGGKSKLVTVEAHLTGLTPGVVYHYDLIATNGAGTEESGDHEFVATLNPAEACPNEQLRIEDNSLALPECRAYEMVTPPGKEGFPAALMTFGGDRVLYGSGAGNIARSGQNQLSNYYVGVRSAGGWKTIPNLNGPSGSINDDPNNFDPHGTAQPIPVEYSADLLSSLWFAQKLGTVVQSFYLRASDGSFSLLAPGAPAGQFSFQIGGTSDDLSHLFITSGGGGTSAGGGSGAVTLWGPGVYEYLGTGNEQPPRRVDVDNTDTPVSTCSFGGNNAAARSAFNSRDGRVALVRVAGGCAGGNPPASELWARIDGTTSIDVSASECDRTAGDPGGVCNDPVGAGGCSYNEQGEEAGAGCRHTLFQAATPDGSRIFFTTRQQLLDADTDEGNDVYACDIPAGTPAPAGDANPCSSLTQVSAGDPHGAEVESFDTSSENGDTVLFTAKGVLAGNADALGEEAVAGDHNLYVWRRSSAQPDGQTTFLGRLESDDVQAQSTPDGRSLVLTTGSALVATDTDDSRDVYRYDVEAGKLTRVSTDIFGVGGNGPFDAGIAADKSASAPGTPGRLSHPAISDDGQKVVFTTAEALSPADGNEEPDAYLWTSDRVSLISTGSVGGGVSPQANSPNAAITAAGRDIFFNTRGALTPADGDEAVDVYDARIGGGFSFAPPAACSGEVCQPQAPGPSGAQTPITTGPPADPGNLKRRACPKGKVLKGGKCVKKKSKKHHGKKHHGKKAAHKRGGRK